MNLSKIFKQDWILTLCVLLLLMIGGLTIYSATYTAETVADGKDALSRQLVFVFLGLFIYFAIMSIDFTWYKYFTVQAGLYLLVLSLLLFVLFFGDPIRNTNRWIEVGFVRIQPSEYAKILLIVINTSIIVSRSTIIDMDFVKRISRKRFWGKQFSKISPVLTKYLSGLILSLVPIILVTMQPALGNAIISLSLVVLIYFVSFPYKMRILAFLCVVLIGVNLVNQSVNFTFVYDFFNWGFYFYDIDLLVVLLSILLVMAIVIFLKLKFYYAILAIFLGLIINFSFDYVYEKVLTDYQRTRVEVFLNPEKDIQSTGWQITQSKIAIGSGRLWGLGYLKGTQTKSQYLPEAYNDFIFAAYAEEFGFVGSIILIGIYITLIIRIVKVAQSSSDTFGVYLAFGAAIMLILHVMINIGMNVGVMPITGIPLPLVSYGGSSVMVNMIILGMVQSVAASVKAIDMADSLVLRSERFL